MQPSALGSDDMESPLQTESHQVSRSLRAEGPRVGEEGSPSHQHSLTQALQHRDPTHLLVAVPIHALIPPIYYKACASGGHDVTSQ